MGSSLPAVIEAEVRLQSTGERKGGEEMKAVSPDPSLEKFDWQGAKVDGGRRKENKAE